jgi:CMP-N-acetylneuraminic acid synthetase
MKIVAIIPARGGSKGTPRKNLEPIGNIPLIARSILVATGADMIDKVFVSTDDSEIAKVADRYGATVIIRPAELAVDTSLSEEAIMHVLDIIDPPDTIVFLQCTSPFTTSADIDAAVRLFIDQKADSLVSVVHTHGFLWKKNRQGYAEAVNHNASVRPRRQDLEPQYLENGAIYVMNVEGFRNWKHRFFGNIAIYEMTQDKFIEIDTPFDMYLAQMMDWHKFDK